VSADTSPEPAPAERSATATGPAEGSWRERAELAEADLAEVRALASDWAATSVPAGDWVPSRTDEVMGSCGRAVLAIAGAGEETPGPKLVRDKIPALIRAQGLEPVTRTASAGEMGALLRDKLAEESREYLASGDPAELADVIEVVYALAALHGLDAAGLEGLRVAKAAGRGTFAARAVWAGNREPGIGEEPS
jgi:predicted house-cleaning noncanonical NTP pyrophosphatase (MazG superfamily)